jgi:hypothetical protein
MENVINDINIIDDIHTIEHDVEEVNEKCRKIDCVIIRDAFDALLKLICDLFRCCFKKCLKSS